MIGMRMGGDGQLKLFDTVLTQIGNDGVAVSFFTGIDQHVMLPLADEEAVGVADVDGMHLQRSFRSRGRIVQPRPGVQGIPAGQAGLRPALPDLQKQKSDDQHGSSGQIKPAAPAPVISTLPVVCHRSVTPRHSYSCPARSTAGG